MRNFPFIFVAFATLSCVTNDKAAQDSDLPSGEKKTSEPILNDAALPVKDVLEEGFCYDDIYASYLRKEFLAQEKPKTKKSKSRETESLFYARRSMLGPMPPYFGALPVIANHEVEFWMSYFKTRGRNTFMKWLVRAEAHREIVDPILKAEGMPPELVYLAMVESGFSNTAASNKRATGTWQFMSGTARLYDLKINHWVDERRDPVKSTLAAARYLRDLYTQFGDWYLAMAAYNAGPGKVKGAIRKAKSRDFWDLIRTPYLRLETKHYVPKVLAALNLATHPKQHGFDYVPDPNDITPKTSVAIDNPVAIPELARHLEIPVKLVKKWNPELNQEITPPTRTNPYSLRLPQSFIERFNEIKAKLSIIEVTDVLMHKIRAGETLAQIARRYKVRIQEIQKMNPRLHAKALRIGKEIAIPVPGVITRREKESA